MAGETLGRCVAGARSRISGGPHGLSFNLYPVQKDRNWDLSVFDLAEYKYDTSRPSWVWTQRPVLATGAS